MSTKNFKALGRYLVEELNKGKSAASAVIDEVYATDIIYHGPFSNEVHGINDFKKNTMEVYDAFPDFHMTIDDIIVIGNRIVGRFKMTGTFKGGLMGMPPTNKKMTVSVIVISRFAGGKVVEEWERFDTLGMLQQLGLLATPKK